MNKTAVWLPGDNMWVLGVVLLINRDYTGVQEGENKTNGPATAGGSHLSCPKDPHRAQGKGDPWEVPLNTKKTQSTTVLSQW